MNKKNTTLLLVSFFSLALSASEVSIDSKNLKSLFEKNNLRSESLRLRALASRTREGSLLRSFLPSLEIYGAQESFTIGPDIRKDQPTYGVEMTVNLFNGGRDLIEEKVRRLESAKQTNLTERLMSEELEKTRSLYWNIRYMQEKLALLKDTAQVNQKNLSSALRRIKSGVTTDSDRFEFEMKDVDLKREMAEAEVFISEGMQILALHLGLSEQDQLKFPETFAHDHGYEELLKHSAKDHDFLFKEDEIESEQTGLKAKHLARDWWPKLDAYAGYDQYNEREKEFLDSDLRSESVVGLRATLSLSAGLESAQESSAKSIEAKALTQLVNYKKRETEIQFHTEMSSLKLLHDQVHDAEENIARAERYYKLTQSEYVRGAKNSPDVLGASEKLFVMKHKRLEIVKNFQVAKAHLLSKLKK